LKTEEKGGGGNLGTGVNDSQKGGKKRNLKCHTAAPSRGAKRKVASKKFPRLM